MIVGLPLPFEKNLGHLHANMRGNDSLFKRLFLAGVGQFPATAVGCACTACARWVTRAAALPRPWLVPVPGMGSWSPRFPALTSRQQKIPLPALPAKNYSLYTYTITFLQ